MNRLCFHDMASPECSVQGRKVYSDGKKQDHTGLFSGKPSCIALQGYQVDGSRIEFQGCYDIRLKMMCFVSQK